jgi:predicted amidohydrolase YtcJ
MKNMSFHEMVIRDVTIWAGKEAVPAMGWVWVKDGRIADVGYGDNYPKHPKMLSKAGCHVLPGLVDAHRHFLMGAMAPQYFDAKNWHSKREALDAIGEACERWPDASSWMVFLGMDHTKWMSGWAPTRIEIDKIVGDRPVLLSDITLHRGILSSAAFTRSGLWKSSYIDLHNDIDSDSSGRPTGMVWEKAFGRVLATALDSTLAGMSTEQITNALRKEATKLISQGYVHVHDIGLGRKEQLLVSSFQQETSLKLSWSVTSSNGLLEAPAFSSQDQITSSHAPKSAKFFMDGAHRCAICLPVGSLIKATASAAGRSLSMFTLSPFRALLEPTVKYEKGHIHTPYLRFKTVENLVHAVKPFAEQDYRIRIHALGNIAAVAAARSINELGLNDRSSIEHIIALSEDEIETVTSTGTVLSLQPGFIPHYASSIEQQGVLPYLRPFPLNSLLQKGATVAISSDDPCGPGEPLHNMRRAVDRHIGDGNIFVQEEAITQSQAVVASSIGALAALGVESEGISIDEPADFTICDGNPFQEQSKVIETWIGGKCVWNATKNPLPNSFLLNLP